MKCPHCGKSITYSSTWQQGRLAKGLCASCGKAKTTKGWYCVRCSAKRAAYAKTRYIPKVTGRLGV